MYKITDADLKRQGVCPEELRRFRRVFPRGVRFSTLRGLQRAWRKAAAAKADWGRWSSWTVRILFERPCTCSWCLPSRPADEAALWDLLCRLEEEAAE